MRDTASLSLFEVSECERTLGGLPRACRASLSSRGWCSWRERGPGVILVRGTCTGRDLPTEVGAFMSPSTALTRTLPKLPAGVNLGGWLLLEPGPSHELFQTFGPEATCEPGAQLLTVLLLYYIILYYIILYYIILYYIILYYILLYYIILYHIML